MHGICNTIKPVIQVLKMYMVRLFYIFLFQKNDNDNWRQWHLVEFDISWGKLSFLEPSNFFYAIGLIFLNIMT